MNERVSTSFSTYSSRPFIITKDRTFTYSEAALITDNIAYSLSTETDISQGDIAVVQTAKGTEFIFFVIALWRIGAIPVPLNTSYTEKEFNDLVSFINPKIVITGDEIVIPQKSSEQEKTSELKEESETDTAVIIFTSGTSGKPKGVMLSFENLYASFDYGNSIMDFIENDRWLVSLPLFHIGGFQIFVRTLLSGASLILPDSSKAEDIDAVLKQYEPTRISLVAVQLKRLIEKSTPPAASLKTVLIGGGFSDDNLILDALEKGWPISKVYGSSETASYFTYMNCRNSKEYISSSGRPLNGNEIQIRDDDNNILPAGQVGNIWLKGKSCSGGYFQNPEETKIKFKDGWYNSGDYGHLNNEGYLFLSARRTDLIVSGGENINPYEVESALKELDKIYDAVVFSEEDEEWGHIVSAAVIAKNDLVVEADEIKKLLKEKLAPFKVPKKFYFLKEFPRNELGKLNKEYLKNTLLK